MGVSGSQWLCVTLLVSRHVTRSRCVTLLMSRHAGVEPVGVRDPVGVQARHKESVRDPVGVQARRSEFVRDPVGEQARHMS